jgi:ribosomal protein S18 acetylase RimI-like enzyme
MATRSSETASDSAQRAQTGAAGVGRAVPFAIRRYARGDERAVIELWRDCGLTRSWNDPAKDVARKLDADPQGFLVGEEDGRIVACAMFGYDGHRGSVNYLAVAPRCRGRGYGRALMQEVERSLRAAGCPKINLLVRVGNEQALGFYARLGFARDDAIALGSRLEVDGPGP